MAELFVFKCPNCSMAQGTQAKTITSCKFCQKSVNMKKVKKQQVKDYKLCSKIVSSLNRKLSTERKYGGF